MKYNILIVDDETSMEKLIKKIFRREQKEQNYVFSYFPTAEDAYQYIGVCRDVDIVLLDIKMPGRMDGLTLLEKINKMNSLVKVIIISAYGDMKRSRLALQHGAFDFLEKPIDADDLKFVVRRAIDHITETKKVTNLLARFDDLSYFVKNDVVDYIRNRSLHQVLNECRRETVAILTAHVKNYIRSTENLDPIARLEQLNEYHTAITEAVDMFNGHIDKYLGDSLLAVFNGEDALQNCVSAGLRVRRQVAEVNQLRGIKGLAPFRVTMGLNAGEVVIGSVGSTDPIRLDHTVIGMPVNVCLRLPKLAEDNELLFVKNPVTSSILTQYTCRQVHRGTVIPGLKNPLIYDLEKPLES